MAVEGIGPTTARVCILMGSPSAAAFKQGKFFTDWEQRSLDSYLLQGRLHPTDIRYEVLDKDRDAAFKRLNTLDNLDTIITLGDSALTFATGNRSIDKWNLSPLDCVESLKCRKVMPTFDMRRLRTDQSLHLYMIKAFARAAEHLGKPWPRKPKNFLCNPDMDKTVSVLSDLYRDHDTLAVDIETGGGVINTMGFAWSPNDAIAIQTLPERCSADNYYNLWSLIARILENPDKKLIFQNLTYESMYLSRYGIRIANYYHDTMWAMRMLWPEFEMGLANVGRFHTMEPYWKDTGKEHLLEGKKKDWANIKDWPEHFRYNCLDTTGTFEAHLSQRKDLESRGLGKLFYGYQMKLGNAIAEMCARGLPVNETTRSALEEQVGAELQSLGESLGENFNPKSPKQKLEFLRNKGYKIPKIRDPKTGSFKESTNEVSLKKLRLKHPEDKDIERLLRYAKLSKALGSYIKISYDEDGWLRYMINGAGTETLRFSSSKDPWDRGLNAQTLPKKYKCMFDAPEGKRWIQIDLKQAESRFVAYDSCDEKLISMLEGGEDIHSYVASHIFGVPMEQVIEEKNSGDPSKRQLGKKSGHGANYSMAGKTFQDSCLKEMDLVIDLKMANRVLDTYHGLFPGIRLWHEAIKSELWRSRKLVNPLGFERYFYGRMDDNTFREAYAFKPQSTIPMITNHLMLGLMDARQKSQFSFTLHLQCHDSVLLLVDDNPDHYLPIRDFALDTKLWHPEIQLPAGKLIIPTDIETGHNLGHLGELQHG